ncbi:MAG: hypothetical protein CME63_02370 [Halobacteriovoraceae bacterium]|nr:hypothetical protein [Halobacteriovoraceae bacterium]
MRFLSVIIISGFLSFSSMGRTYEFIGSYFPEILEAQSNGKVIGLGADLTHRIAREMDVDINITLYPLKRAHLIMQRG